MGSHQTPGSSDRNTWMTDPEELYVDFAFLPAELLQACGSHLTPYELRNARLVCKHWATSLALCMPNLTMALPHQASSAIFRQPLMLYTSGSLSTSQPSYYTAAPISPTPVQLLHQPSAAAKSTPFATKGGQAAVGSMNSSSSSLHRHSPFSQADSLPVDALTHTRSSYLPRSAAAAAAAADSALQWQNSGVSCGWSSLPSAGLRTCSSLQQLTLQLSGAPPSPEDLLDLTTLPRLTHLSFRQVGQLDTTNSIQQSGKSTCSSISAAVGTAAAAGCSSSSFPAGRSKGLGLAVPEVMSVTSAAAALESFHISSPTAASSIASVNSLPGTPSSSSSSNSYDSSSSRGSLDKVAGWQGAASMTSTHSLGPTGSSCSCHAAAAHDEDHAIPICTPGSSNSSMNLVRNNWLFKHQKREAGPPSGISMGTGDSSDKVLCCDQSHSDAQPTTTSAAANTPTAAAAAAAAATVGTVSSPQCVSCSVLTPHHVQALAQLPHLSSLELQPKNGIWDSAATAALLQLSRLTGLTRLCVTWGSASDAEVQLTDQEAVKRAHGSQLPLQQCLLGLTWLRELELRGDTVVDIAVLQKLQQLQRLHAEALKVVNSDVLLKIQQLQEEEGAAADAAAGHAQRDVREDDEQQQQQQPAPKWATLPKLEYLHAVHPAADISVLLQSTQTPLLSDLGFIARQSGDFARLLGQHGKIKVLHLIFPELEPWHTIAVVRLPTALPSLRSLTLEGKFWLPNSLIVALGVMEVPLQELSLKCKLAVPCLDRLQHLRTVRKLGLHHLAVSGPPEGLITKDTMLQLPSKLLPAGLKALEISNGWILH